MHAEFCYRSQETVAKPGSRQAASTPKSYEAIIQVEAILGQTTTEKVVVYGSVQDTARG